MTFYEWISRLKDKDTPTGDLAGDILRDRNFPKDAAIDEVEAYIRRKATHPDVVKAFKVARQSYLRYQKNHTG